MRKHVNNTRLLSQGTEWNHAACNHWDGAGEYDSEKQNEIKQKPEKLNLNHTISLALEHKP